VAIVRRVDEPDWLIETRTAYDTVAQSYAEMLRDALATSPWDRAMLAGFAESITTAGGGAVVEVGCGPGRVSAHLHDLGLDVRGVDLSPAMIASARAAYPHLGFDVGSMTGMKADPASLAGLVAWYSIIHIPPPRQPEVFAEFARVLRPGGLLLLAFQVGDERRHITEGYGHPVTLSSYRLPPERIADQLTAAGFTVEVRTLREPVDPEKVPQAYLLAQRRTSEDLRHPSATIGCAIGDGPLT
jgi:SAM-dependent methyltransferase